jgi:rare lipoprotein A
MRRCVCVVAVAAGSAFLLAGTVEAGSKLKTEGLASWYKMGTKTANGESYEPMGITAAHPTLPFGTKVRVTNAGNGQSVVVRINDRGPFTGGRIIDLSKGAAKAISMRQAGVARVQIEVVDTAKAAEVAAAPSEEPVEAAAAETVQVETAQVTAAPPLVLMAEKRNGGSPR